MKKVSVILAAIFAVSTVVVLAQQADLIKKKAKDLKRNVESGQTNSVPRTNSPAKR